MKVIILGSFSIDGMSAPSARAMHFADGLTKSGATVELLPLGRTPIKITEEKECHKNQHKIVWINRLIQGSKYSLLRQLINYVSVRLTLVKIVSSFLTNTKIPPRVLFFNISFIDSVLCLFLLREKPIRTYLELCEWFPAGHFKGGYASWRFYDAVFVRNLIAKKVDGVICISRDICHKAGHIGVVRRLIIPSMILPRESALDCLKQKEVNNRGKKVFSLTYSGKGKDEDGLLIIIEALNLLLMRGYNVELRISGPLSDESIRNQLSYLSNQMYDELHSRIFYDGWLSRTEYIKFIEYADCFILPRPESQITRANFPTRLPEFLSFGIPVIIGSAGDVGELLKDRYDAILLPPVPVAEDVFEGVKFLIENPEARKQISRNAINSTEAFFSSDYHGQRVFDFMIDSSGAI